MSVFGGAHCIISVYRNDEELSLEEIEKRRSGIDLRVLKHRRVDMSRTYS